MRRYVLGFVFVVLYLYAFPYFSSLRSANEMPRILLAEEIVDHRTFRIDARLSELGSQFDVATTPEGHHYSNKAPGMSLLAVPAYVILKALTGGAPSAAQVTWAFRFSTSTLPALLFLPFFAAFLGRFAKRPRGRDAALLAYSLGSMAFPYALLFMSHQTSAVCIAGAFIIAVHLAVHLPVHLPVHLRDGATPKLGLAVGALCGLGVLVDYQAALAVLILGLYLVRRAPRALPYVVAGGVPFLAVLLAYHAACFGSPFKTGYSFAVDPAHKQGWLGVIGPNWPALKQVLVTPDNGLLVLSPWVILSIVGVLLSVRDREIRAEALVCATVALAYILFVGSLAPEFGRAGWSIGPRYASVAMPFLACLAAITLSSVDEHPRLRTLCHALVLVGVIVHVVAGMTYPHWPTTFRNPLYEVSFRALSENLAPHSFGTWIGLRGWVSLLPAFGLVATLIVALLGRRRWRQTAVAVLLAAAAVASYRVFPKTMPAEDRFAFIRDNWEPR